MSDMLERINKLQTELDQLRREFENPPNNTTIQRNTLYLGAMLLDNNGTTINRILFIDNFNRFFSFALDGTNTRSGMEIEKLPMLGIPFTVGSCNYVFRGKLEGKEGKVE